MRIGKFLRDSMKKQSFRTVGTQRVKNAFKGHDKHLEPEIYGNRSIKKGLLQKRR